ncbi:MAG TPA: carboxymuconolactone decarboxylase family protein [Solirubrobacteraceae bacterium]|jgi:AhpD family alkylhydroperoxidase|nr:carboxymuconolactone decarboxylase family protein [Solirubrobacteraceae bacterium]
MSRIPPATKKNLFVRFTEFAARREYGRDMSPVGVLAHRPRILFGYGIHEKAVASKPRLPARLSCLAQLKAAAVVACEFCVDIGSHVAREAGVTGEELLDLPRYRESERFDALDTLVLDYTVAVTRTPCEVTDEVVARLREHLDDPQIVELTHMIALENQRARFNCALDLEPAGFSEGKVCAVPEREPTPAGATA